MSIFDWFKPKKEAVNYSKQEARRPATRDYTDSMQVNGDLTRQLFHNAYPGLKLAGAMAFAPIAVPVWFIGLPVPKSDNEILQEQLKIILEQKSRKITQINLQSHREGTIWIYPFFSAKEKKVIWEFIPDDIVSDIIRNIDTGEIMSIITDESITVSTGYNKTATVGRRRTFTRTKVITQWTQKAQIPSQLVDKAQRNVSGILPIPFANNADGDEVRGHSDYERILPDLKSYHDIDLNWSYILAKFAPKMVQYISDTVEEWKANNGIDDINTDLDISTIDLIFNKYDQEKTEFAFPQNAHEAFVSALQKRFKKIVDGSGIPEMLFGTKVEGNHATAEEQMDILVKFIEDKRKQKNDAYQKLFETTILLERTAGLQPMQETDITIEWNALDAVSEKTKSEIFFNFARGMNQLIAVAGITKKQSFELWRYLYAFATENDFEKFKLGLSEMARHKQFTNLDYDIGVDMSGGEGEEEIDGSTVQ